jgi:Mg2+-importing ATPase
MGSLARISALTSKTTPTGVIVHTGAKTYFGQLADQIAGRRELTSFDKGVNRFIWLMIRFMLVMVPGVFLINGLTKGNWLEALLFAVAVAGRLDAGNAAHDRDCKSRQGRDRYVEKARDREAP